ncbi:hypothetical protein [Arthrobacter sp. Br18]|uniref:hypothetical protein n=1 Tax=Arthrobacter sp. Br18 TaxID=1312954 RepID=UPI00047D503D|nr:hypothetical protein [Arthrobacter sp. Br18]
MNPNADRVAQSEVGHSEPGFTAWPRPLSTQALGTVKKALLVVLVLIGAYQIVPAGNFGSAVSQAFTLLVILSWLGPGVRVLMQLSRGRRGSQQEDPPAV